MRWFGFGFNAFGQICDHEGSRPDASEVKVINPAEIKKHEDKSDCRLTICRIRACWSRRASLHLDDGSGSRVCVAGFGTVPDTDRRCGVSMEESYGCEDAIVGESYLTLAFPDRVECWDLQGNEKTRTWSMEIETHSGHSGPSLNLPLVPGGYIAAKPPLYRPLSPELNAKSLVLGAEHAILLTTTGTVYTWGLGSHGQLGHGGLTPEEEPRAVEALWGMPMSSVATGGWHSGCISDAGDLYVWGWNESGQLGLPSRALRNAKQQSSPHTAPSSHQDAGTSPGEEPEGGKESEDVFISIQAFPALLDVTPCCEVKTISCGSRHTAAVTTTGDLYTWGWGEYGQLGHKTLTSSDEPQRVEFFREQRLRVVDVECGAWNTFAAIAKEETA
ncbi:RCC1 domain-containing protein 1 [Genypterus blacodes]|uniref:RCC1 domain-containing protein 1 n=1 Tax=Genypterus blacodes TaxID=154954 RepID=UPI003F75B378